MEKILIILAFLFIRYLLTPKKENKKKANAPKPEANPNAEPATSIEDMFGDFMKEIKKQKAPKPQTKTVVNTNQRDFHKAEEDGRKKLDWQQVSKPKPSVHKPMTYHDYSKVSHSNIPDAPLEVAEVYTEPKIEIEFDLKQAILYKEILERKYFSV